MAKIFESTMWMVDRNPEAYLSDECLRMIDDAITEWKKDREMRRSEMDDKKVPQMVCDHLKQSDMEETIKWLVVKVEALEKKLQGRDEPESPHRPTGDELCDVFNEDRGLGQTTIIDMQQVAAHYIRSVLERFDVTDEPRDLLCMLSDDLTAYGQSEKKDAS